MKYYKLKKDLPTFRAREEFYFNDKGDLVSAEERRVAYSAKTLVKFPNILKDWFEKTNIGFYLNEGGYIVEYDENEDPYCLNYRKSIGNDFETEAEAKKYGEYLKALQAIKDDTKGFKPDWKNFDQPKYYGHYDYNPNSLTFDWGYCFQCQGAIYFETEEDIEDSFKKHRTEWLIVLGVEE